MMSQVHKAVLRRPDGTLQPVAVKVRHPGVAQRIRQDFMLLMPLARFASRFKALKGLSIHESVSQFSHTMTAQTDLRAEAIHMLRFHANFAGMCSSVLLCLEIDLAAGHLDAVLQCTQHNICMMQLAHVLGHLPLSSRSGVGSKGCCFVLHMCPSAAPL